MQEILGPMWGALVYGAWRFRDARPVAASFAALAVPCLAPDGRIVEAPSFFFEVLEVDRRRSPSIYHLFDPDDPPYMSFSRVVRRTNGVIEYHVAIHGSLGGSRGFRYWALPAVDEKMNARACTFYITDESAVIQGYEWERRRIRREILRDVQTTVSDFLNQKLSGIRALAEVLRDVPEAAEETGARIVGALDELRAAIAQMGQTSVVNALGNPDHRPIRVAELSDVLSAWSRGKVPIASQVVEADEEAFLTTSVLEGVLLPVVNNAIEATRGADPVEIRVQQIDETCVEIEVSDSGAGMPQGALDRCEDPFYTTKAGHLGLGLTNANEFLQRVGGEWTIDSSPRRGTHVTVRLPLISEDDLLDAES